MGHARAQSGRHHHFPVDLGGRVPGCELQQMHHPLAGLNLIRLPDGT
jgi:hypothetical protein